MGTFEYEALKMLPQVYDFTVAGPHFLESRSKITGDTRWDFDNAWKWRVTSLEHEHVIRKGTISVAMLQKIAYNAGDNGSTNTC